MSKLKFEKTYLGDGVYLRGDGFHLILTTENGISTTNEIYLDSTVLVALDAILTKIKETKK